MSVVSVLKPAQHTGPYLSGKPAMSTGMMSCLISVLVLTGCAAPYIPPALTTQHPAHPEALAAPALPPSTTLAYRASDIPTPQPASFMAHRGTASESGSQERVMGEGTVMALVPSSGQIVLDHREIPGFMDAMTMGYRIEPPSLLEKVQAGDAVRFSIDPVHKAIVTLEKMMAQRETPHGGHGMPPAVPPGQQTVVGEGTVIAVVPSSHQIVLDHKAIPGFMDAMTMGYRVEPPSLLEKVQTGDVVRFTIDPQQKAIVTIEKMSK